MESLFGKVFLIWAAVFGVVALGYGTTLLVLKTLSKISFARVESHSGRTFRLGGGGLPILMMAGSMAACLVGLYLFMRRALPEAGLGCVFLYGSLAPLFWLTKTQREWTWGPIIRVLVIESLALAMFCEAPYWESPLLTSLKLILGLFFCERLLKYWLILRRCSINESSRGNFLLVLVPSITAISSIVPWAAKLGPTWENAFLTFKSIHSLVFQVFGRLFTMVA